MLNYDVKGQNILSASNTSALSSLQTMNTTNTAQNAMYYASGSNGSATLWHYWQDDYYPKVIREAYPIYLQERAMDRGAKAHEILKCLMDKGLVKLDKVKDYIEAMDVLIKTL